MSRKQPRSGLIPFYDDVAAPKEPRTRSSTDFGKRPRHLPLPIRPLPIRPIGKPTRHSEPTETEFTALCKKHKKIIFKTEGKLIGAFEYHDGTFICFNERRQPCMEISIHRTHIYLEDFFYEAHNNGYTCEMKPKEGDTAGKQRILDTLLSYLAFQTGVDKISLIDASTKTFNTCSEIPASIFKLAGRQTYYERFGFMNSSGEMFEQARAQLVESDELNDAKKIGFSGKTTGELASFILPLCKDRKYEDDRSDIINALLFYLEMSIYNKVKDRKYTKYTFKKYSTSYVKRKSHLIVNIKEV